MKHSGGFYPRVRVDAGGSGVVSHAVRRVDADGPRSVWTWPCPALGPWRKPFAAHDPAKIVSDLAVTLALGGDCLADIAVLRGEPGVFGAVASDPTVSRAVATLAADAPPVLAAINTARVIARSRAWALGEADAPNHGTNAARPLVVDVGRDPGHRAQRQGRRCADVQARVRTPAAVGIPRRRARWHRGTAGVPAPARERRVEHRRRSHHRGPRRVASAAVPPARHPAGP